MVKRNTFVEIGRVVCVNYGPDAGKLCVVIDVIDQNFALVDGGNQTGVSRGKLNFKHMAITNIKVDIARSPKTATVGAAIVKADVAGQWAASSWGKKLAAQAKRAARSDFDRFNTMILRKKVLVRTTPVTPYKLRVAIEKHHPFNRPIDCRNRNRMCICRCCVCYRSFLVRTLLS